MKNNYTIQDDKTIVYIERQDGQILEFIIDTDDLDKVKSFKNLWGATRVRGKTWLIKGTYRENKEKKNITLSRYILDQDVNDNSPVRFINGNQLDHRKVNLTIGYEEIQIIKGNEYEILDEKTLIKLNRRDDVPIETQIDTDDLERVLNKGTWFAEWHVDFNNYLVQNVSYFYVDGKKKRKKVALHSFIMGTDSKKPIKHGDGDTLNNCKCNLKVYSREMMNDYVEVDDETIEIILNDKNGKERARTLIDKEDLERVFNRGYTWCFFKAKGEPYAVSTSLEGRSYLHRFIMDTPEGMVTDHKNHDTLDNRKKIC